MKHKKTLELPYDLHQALREVATQNLRSVNQEIVRILRNDPQVTKAINEAKGA